MKLTKQFTSIIIFVFVLPVLTTLSCKKQPINLGDITENATVIDAGSPAADGCGWLIEIDGTNNSYSPTNLPDIYKTANLKVHISYKILSTRFQCGMVATNTFPQIQLDAITKQ
ncbi:MAG TPA: hypothetical protein VNW95_06115 [Mucilaginibacter sp.]|jgi:hypothetical protein|nr:hypothetical protein [Mucilaginibacter sp.]